MEKLVWDKVKGFLEVLRCEDVDRESIVNTKELQEAKQTLSNQTAVYQQCIANIQKEDQEKIKGYVEALNAYSSEECRQSYLQGMVDCMTILCGAGILKPKSELETLLITLLLYFPAMSGHFPKGCSALLACIVAATGSAGDRSYSPQSVSGG